MPKTINTNLKFKTATDTTESYDNTTGGKSYSKTYTIPNYENYTCCPHRLPCGDCAITMRPCHKIAWDTWEITW